MAYQEIQNLKLNELPKFSKSAQCLLDKSLKFQAKFDRSLFHYKNLLNIVLCTFHLEFYLLYQLAKQLIPLRCLLPKDFQVL